MEQSDIRNAGEGAIMKNIFVEGIQGMGKSTLVNKLAYTIPELKVCREGDYSPVDLAWCTRMTKEQYETILEKYKEIQDEIRKKTVMDGEYYVVSYTQIITDILNFHKDLEQYEVYNGRTSLEELKEIVLSRYKKFSGTGYVFECAFFQNIMEDLILFHMLSDDEIIDFYRELYELVDKDEFILFYLHSEDLEETIRIIRKERSDHFGNEMWYNLMLQYLMHSPLGKKEGYRSFEDLIAHLKHRQALELRVIQEVIGENAVLLKSKEWKMEEVLELINN